jgi:hypothetical protein
MVHLRQISEDFRGIGVGSRLHDLKAPGTFSAPLSIKGTSHCLMVTILSNMPLILKPLTIEPCPAELMVAHRRLNDRQLSKLRWPRLRFNRFQMTRHVR